MRSTRPRGARQKSTCLYSGCHSFNPRTRAGRDGWVMKPFTVGMVSIHAPAWGRDRENWEPYSPHWFQSTRPRGARRRLCWRRGLGSSFNPRARAGRDKILWIWNQGLYCFNPRARAGRDREYIKIANKMSGFNPRARAGRDAIFQSWDYYTDVSIHAPARGATYL